MARNFTGLGSVMAKGGYRTYMAGKVWHSWSPLSFFLDTAYTVMERNFLLPPVGCGYGYA